MIAAPSGAGKTSLVRALMQREPSLGFSISCTTRKQRPNEVHGEDYFFVDTQEEFVRMVEAGEFLEFAKVFDNHYGTPRRPVEDALDAGRNLILEIDWQGAQQVRQAASDCKSVFILPPSRIELETRLRNRKTDSDEVIERRLRDAVADMSHYAEFDFVIVNDDFEAAVGQLLAILRGGGTEYGAKRPDLAALVADLLG